jgi:ATP-dependent DNA ligase
MRAALPRAGWIYEEKYNCWRMVAYKDGTSVHLVSRAGKEHSRRLAEFAESKIGEGSCEPRRVY